MCVWESRFRPQTVFNINTKLKLVFKNNKKRENIILIYIQQDATLHSVFYLESALHVSGGTTTHHQESKQLYLQHLVFVTPLLLSALSWKSWNWFEYAVHNTAHSNQFHLFHDSADISNVVTNTRCCRYSCLRSWWWVVVPPETCRALSR